MDEVEEAQKQEAEDQELGHGGNPNHCFALSLADGEDAGCNRGDAPSDAAPRTKSENEHGTDDVQAYAHQVVGCWIQAECAVYQMREEKRGGPGAIQCIAD